MDSNDIRRYLEKIQVAEKVLLSENEAELKSQLVELKKIEAELDKVIEEKPIIPQQPVKSMASEESKKKLETAKTDLEAKLAEELRLKKELAEMQKMLGE